MTKSTRTTLIVTCLLILIGSSNSYVKIAVAASDIREVQKKTYANNRAPAKCLTAFRAFFRYVQKPEPSIITDQQAQNRWLSRLLRRALADHLKLSGSPQENPDYPRNSTFVGVWDYPTTFSIVGSRHYDYRNSENPDDNRAVIDVLYEWDKKGSLDNQYPGSKSLRSFIFVYEDGAWKLDDIYTFSDKYAAPASLRSYFSKS